MRSKFAFYNTAAAAAVQIVTAVVGILLPRFILVSYGSTINGLISSVTQFVRYLYIVEMGLGGSIIYHLYQPIAEHNVGKISGVMSAAKLSYRKIGGLFSLLLLAASVLYPFLIQKEKIDLYTTVLLIVSIGATGLLDFFTTAKYNAFLMAAQRSYISSVFRILYLFFNTVIMLVFILLRFNIAVVYLISIVANVLYSLLMGLYMHRTFPQISYRSPPDQSALSKRYDVVVHQISSMVVFNIPFLILTIFASLKEVSVYAVYNLVFSGISLAMGIFNTGMSSGFGEMLILREKKPLLKTYSEYELLYYMVVTVVFACTIVLGLPFVQLYTKGIKDIAYVNPMILLLFLIAGLLDAWKVPQSTMIVAAGHYRQTRHRAIIEAAVTIVCCTVFTWLWGVYGTLLGRICGLSYRSIDLFYVRRLMDYRFRSTASRLIRIFFIGGLVVLPFEIRLRLHPGSFSSWLLIAFAVFIWASLVTAAGNLLFERNAMKDLLRRGKRVLLSAA